MQACDILDYAGLKTANADSKIILTKKILCIILIDERNVSPVLDYLSMRTH